MELLNWVKGNQLHEIAQWLEGTELNDDEKRSWLTNGLGGVTTLHWVMIMHRLIYVISSAGLN
jgi:gluconate kinase